MQAKQLINALSASFDHEELRDIAVALGFDHQNIPGQTKKTYARELFIRCAQHDKLEGLLNECRQLRPNRQWPEHTQLENENEINTQSGENISKKQSKRVSKISPIIILIGVATILLLGITVIIGNIQDPPNPIAPSATPQLNTIISPTVIINTTPEVLNLPVWENRTVLVDLANHNCDQAFVDEIKERIKLIDSGVIISIDNKQVEVESPDARIKLDCTEETYQFIFEFLTLLPIFHTVATPEKLTLSFPKSISTDDLGRIIRAFIYYAQGNFAAVIDNLDSISNRETIDKASHLDFLYANSLLLTTNYKKALQRYDSLLQQESDVNLLIIIYNNQAIALLNQSIESGITEDSKIAIKQIFDEALSLHEDEEVSQIDATIIANQWFAFLEIGLQQEMTKDTCQTALLINSNDPMANVCAGASLIVDHWFSADCNQELLEEAEKLYFKKAFHNADNLIDIYYWQGLLQVERLTKCEHLLSTDEIADAVQNCQDTVAKITTLRKAGYAPLYVNAQMEQIMSNYETQCNSYGIKNDLSD